MTGRFIAFEGGEACGKSTQAARLADAARGACSPASRRHRRRGRGCGRCCSTPRPRLADRAEALLMAADRAQHVAEVIRPALAAGRHVVTDRYAGSSLAYQGFGRGLPVDEVAPPVGLGVGGLWPDLVVLLDVPLERGGRAAGRRAGPTGSRRPATTSTGGWPRGSAPWPRPTAIGGWS